MRHRRMLFLGHSAVGNKQFRLQVLRTFELSVGGECSLLIELFIVHFW